MSQPDLSSMMRPGAFHDEAAAKRFHQALIVHRLGLSHDEIIAKRFIAVRLSDGSSDGVAYDDRVEALNHQLNPEWCCPFQIPVDVIDVHVCDSLLWYMRTAYDNGYRPHHGHLILPQTIEDYPA